MTAAQGIPHCNALQWRRLSHSSLPLPPLSPHLNIGPSLLQTRCWALVWPRSRALRCLRSTTPPSASRTLSPSAASATASRGRRPGRRAASGERPGCSGVISGFFRSVSSVSSECFQLWMQCSRGSAAGGCSKCCAPDAMRMLLPLQPLAHPLPTPCPTLCHSRLQLLTFPLQSWRLPAPLQRRLQLHLPPDRRSQLRQRQAPGAV